jgi:hypothetical protein
MGPFETEGLESWRLNQRADFNAATGKTFRGRAARKAMLRPRS